VIQLYRTIHPSHALEDSLSSFVFPCSCPAGKYTNGTRAANCVDCPSGTYSAAPRDACDICPIGTRPSADSGATGCIACTAGRYAQPGSAAESRWCTPCPVGQLSPAGAGTCCDGVPVEETANTTAWYTAYVAAGGMTGVSSASARYMPLARCEVGRGSATVSCVSPYLSASSANPSNPNWCMAYNYTDHTCTNRRNLIDLVTPCRPANYSACQQPVYCNGSAATCAYNSEVLSTVTAAGARLVVVGAATTAGSTVYWSSARSLTLTLTGSFSAPQYCPAPVFLVGTAVAPVQGCASASSESVITWVPLPTSSQPHGAFTVTDASLLTNGASNCVWVKALGFRNQLQYAGARSHFSVVPLSNSSAVFVDTTPPVAGTLLHCIRGEGDVQQCDSAPLTTCSSSCLYVSWTGVADATDAVAFLLLRVVGSGPGAAVYNLIQTSVAADAGSGSYSNCSLGVTLPHGMAINASLTAVDRAGNRNSTWTVHTLTVDNTVPVNTSVIANGNTMGLHRQYWDRSDVANVSFGAFSNPHDVAIAKYDVSLVVTDTGMQVVRGQARGVTPVQHLQQSTLSLTRLGLSCGTSYTWRITSTSAVGCSSIVESDPFVVDTTPPVADADSAVIVPVSSDDTPMQCTTSNSVVRVKFSGLYDDCSSVVAYEAAVATEDNDIITPWASYSWPTSTSGDAIRLKDHSMDIASGEEPLADGVYRLAVRATDQVGLSSVGYSATLVTVDTVPPVFTTTPNDTLSIDDSQDIEYSSMKDTVCVSWSVTDAGSGTSAIFASLVRASDGSTLLGPNAVPLSSISYCFPKMDVAQVLESGAVFQTVLVAVDACGLSTTTSSNGLLFDNTPPVMGTVHDGLPLPDKPLDSHRDSFFVGPPVYAAHWQSPLDAASPLASLVVVFHPCGTPQVQLAASGLLRPNTTVFRRTGGLQGRVVVGTLVCVTLVATDVAGNVNSATSSGAVCNATAPVGATIGFGMPGAHTAHLRLWNVDMGVRASYDLRLNPSTQSLQAMEWALFQCPPSHWVFPLRSAASQFSGLNSSCTLLQDFSLVVPLSGSGNSIPLVNAGVQLLNGTALVIAARGVTRGFPMHSIPLALSQAVVVDLRGAVSGSSALVTVGLFPGEAAPLVDCRLQRTVPVHWTGFATPPGGLLGYDWVLQQVAAPDEDQSKSKELAAQAVGLAPVTNVPCNLLEQKHRYIVIVRSHGQDGAVFEKTTSRPFRVVTKEVQEANISVVASWLAADVLSVEWQIVADDPVFASSDKDLLTAEVSCSWSAGVLSDSGVPVSGDVAVNTPFKVPMHTVPPGVDFAVTVSCFDVPVRRWVSGMSEPMQRAVTSGPSLDPQLLRVTVGLGGQQQAKGSAGAPVATAMSTTYLQCDTSSDQGAFPALAWLSWGVYPSSTLSELMVTLSWEGAVRGVESPVTSYVARAVINDEIVEAPDPCEPPCTSYSFTAEALWDSVRTKATSEECVSGGVALELVVTNAAGVSSVARTQVLMIDASPPVVRSKCGALPASFAPVYCNPATATSTVCDAIEWMPETGTQVTARVPSSCVVDPESGGGVAVGPGNDHRGLPLAPSLRRLRPSAAGQPRCCECVGEGSPWRHPRTASGAACLQRRGAVLAVGQCLQSATASEGRRPWRSKRHPDTISAVWSVHC
jgi:hypothetical protein